ncbi:hypothetical protein IFM89_017642 [Coptis chinensis]|uniref:Reticulon-like protein n=1 Tax=Coptis chinensis TaxID=261450 RepID=A0A835GZU6_9MAGN|nr:hypothetical protein IFM89_017642 [Coptis chinensis]
MPEKITAENLLNNIMDTFTEQHNAPKPKNMSFFEEDKSASVSDQINRLFGRQKPVHNVLGGGKSADVLLWRNKKISASVLTGATAIWVIFEWLNYHLLTMVFFALLIGMLAQFAWTPSKVPRVRLPEELFANIGVSIGAEVNRFLGYLQNVACGGNLKQFLMVVLSLWIAAVIGSWCNFLTVLYIGFIGAHTLPVLYERYEDQIDSFVYKILDQLQHQYGKIDSKVLSRIPKGSFKGKKFE